MTYWLAIEAHELLLASSVTGPAAPDLALVDSVWSGDNDRSLFDSLDVLEAYDFLYSFLLYRIFPLVGWLTVRCTRRSCPCLGRDFILHLCRLRLRPPEILSLALRCLNASSTETKGGLACQQWDLSNGNDDAGSCWVRGGARGYHSVRKLEHAVEMQLSQLATFPQARETANVWTCFRKYWDREARGSVFWWTVSAEAFVERIRRYATDAACSTRHPNFVRLSKEERTGPDHRDDSLVPRAAQSGLVTAASSCQREHLTFGSARIHRRYDRVQWPGQPCESS